LTKLTRFFAVKGQGQAHRAKRKARVFPPGWKPWLYGRPEARRYLAARITPISDVGGCDAPYLGIGKLYHNSRFERVGGGFWRFLARFGGFVAGFSARAAKGLG
jgi:hypothetical protein